MTRSKIRDMARKRLGEVSGVFWSDTELNSWIDQAGSDVAFKTKSIKTDGYMTPVESTADYALSAVFPNLLAVLELYYKISGTTWKKLDPIANREDMDFRFPGWMNVEAGTPNYYYWNKEEDKLMFFPKPDSTNAGTNYSRVFYARTYTAITDDAISPALPEPLHLAIVDWVASLGYETRGYGDKANDAMAKYDARIQKYLVETRREKEDDEIVMKSYRRR